MVTPSPHRRDCIRSLDIVFLAFCVGYATVSHLGAAQQLPLGYDEGWHILISQLEPLHLQVREILRVPHPPTIFLALGPLADLGTSPLWPRLVSIVPAALQPPLLWAIGRQIGTHRAIGYAGVTVFTISYPFAVMSTVVRGYSLATTLLLAALACATRLTPGIDRPSRAAASGALALSTAAAWVLYPSALITASYATSVALFALLNPVFRSRMKATWAGSTRWPERVFFVAGHALLMLYLLAGRRPGFFSHLTRWFPDSESVLEFGWQGVLQNLAYFGGSDLVTSAVAPYVVVVLSVSLLAAIGMTAIRGCDQRGIPRSVLALLPVALAAAMWLLAIAHAYPFGGELRHQYILFPPLVLAAIVVADELAGVLQPVRSPVLLISLAIVAAGGLLTHRSFEADLAHEFVNGDWWEPEGEIVLDSSSRFPTYLSFYNFVGYYGAHRKLGWHWEGSPIRGIERYRVGSHPGSIVYWDRYVWTLDEEQSAAMPARLSELMAAEELAALHLVGRHFPLEPSRMLAAGLTVADTTPLSHHGSLFLVRTAEDIHSQGDSP